MTKQRLTVVNGVEGKTGLDHKEFTSTSDPELRLEKDRQDRAMHVSASRQWAIENPDEHRKHSRQYYYRHRERCLKRSRAYRETHRKELLEYGKQWRKRNTLYLKEFEKARRQTEKRKTQELDKTHRRRSQQKTGDSIPIGELRIRDKDICHICKKLVTENFTIDHIIPLSRGGTHTWDNVGLAHNRCNNIKGIKTLEELEGNPGFA